MGPSRLIRAWRAALTALALLMLAQPAMAQLLSPALARQQQTMDRIERLLDQFEDAQRRSACIDFQDSAATLEGEIAQAGLDEPIPVGSAFPPDWIASTLSRWESIRDRGCPARAWVDSEPTSEVTLLEDTESLAGTWRRTDAYQTLWQVEESADNFFMSPQGESWSATTSLAGFRRGSEIELTATPGGRKVSCPSGSAAHDLPGASKLTATSGDELVFQTRPFTIDSKCEPTFGEWQIIARYSRVMTSDTSPLVAERPAPQPAVPVAPQPPENLSTAPLVICPATMPGGAQELTCRCPYDDAGGTVWGTYYYTGDSSLSARPFTRARSRRKEA